MPAGLADVWIAALAAESCEVEPCLEQRDVEAGESRQFVITAREEQFSRNGSLPPLGTRRQVIADLFHCNTGPEREGDDVLYGPGFTLELTPGQDPLTQMLLTITEDEIGWMALMRIAKRQRWKILDPMTGRALEP